MNQRVSTERIEHWIGGASVASGEADCRFGEVTNPATGEVIRQVALGGATDVAGAVAAARAALPGWRATPPMKRARVMMKYRELLETHREALVQLITQEHGKTLDDARGEVTRGIEVVEFAMGIPQLLKGEIAPQVGTGVDTYSIHQPVGVCAGITPFNFPAMVPLWMFPMAVACGNTFVLKPSEKVPSAALLLARLAKDAGLPDGVLNVVNGDKAAVDALLTHPDVNAVSFVGSTPIAQYIYSTASAHGKRVQALGGAKNHGVVMPDADLDFTVDALIGAAYGSAGERCMAISVAVAVGDVADALVARLAQAATSLPVDYPRALRQGARLCRRRCRRRCEARGGRPWPQGRTARRRLLHRPVPVRQRDAGDVDLSPRDFRTSAGRGAREDVGRSDRAHQP